MVDFLSGKEEMKIQQKVNSVIFVLDVSNSMNSEDVAPIDFSKPKYFEKLSSADAYDKVLGIVVFAEAQSIMPLTSDHTGVETYIDAINQCC